MLCSRTTICNVLNMYNQGRSCRSSCNSSSSHDDDNNDDGSDDDDGDERLHSSLNMY